jgi:hypothetical protein
MFHQTQYNNAEFKKNKLSQYFGGKKSHFYNINVNFIQNPNI